MIRPALLGLAFAGVVEVVRLVGALAL